MTRSLTVHTSLAGSREAGMHIGQKITSELQGKKADLILIFASSRYEYPILLRAIQESANPGLLVGCSSAGEFVNGSFSEGSVSAVAISSEEMIFNASMGRNLRGNREKALKQLVEGLKGNERDEFPHRAALVLTDALAGEADELINEMITLTAGAYDLFGGGAGDDAKFSATHIFSGTEAISDAVLALELLSKKPIGISLYHGWKPSSQPMRVTSAQGAAVRSLNSVPTLDILKRHAEETSQRLDLSNPMPFLMHNVFGIRTEKGFKIRVPLGIQTDGSISCAAEIPEGATVQLMQTSSAWCQEAANAAIESALSKLEGARPSVVLLFDCVATRFRSGTGYGHDLATVTRSLKGTPYAGFNTYGQIARTEGQFLGFHNATTVVCAIPE